jgi:ParB family transcriptional regulator, chromosome partitioning protein
MRKPFKGTMKIADIKVGKRFRKDMGDLAGLVASMGDFDIGPIVVRPVGRGHELVCGARRLAAAKQRGQTTVSVIVRNLT